jgi:hypothetical protein
MSDESAKEHAPTPEELEREARRLARRRHLSLVREAPATPTIERLVALQEPEPEPRPAA